MTRALQPLCLAAMMRPGTYRYKRADASAGADDFAIETWRRIKGRGVVLVCTAYVNDRAASYGYAERVRRLPRTLDRAVVRHWRERGVLPPEEPKPEPERHAEPRGASVFDPAAMRAEFAQARAEGRRPIIHDGPPARSTEAGR